MLQIYRLHKLGRTGGRTGGEDPLLDLYFAKATHVINRGSYMSAHVLLNLLYELGKRDKMRGLPSILSLFRNEFNKIQ